MIKELTEIGLTENESKVYLALLEHNCLTPTDIAKATGMHRSYIYDTLSRLLEKGIVNTIYLNGKKHFQANDPRVLREIYELKLKQFDTLLPQLNGLFSSANEETRVELHKGKRVYKTLIKSITSECKEKDIVYIIGAREALLSSVEPIYLKQYFNIIREKNVVEKIIVRKDEKQVKENFLEYREIDPEYLDETTIVIHHEKVFIFIWENPYCLITIFNPHVANTYKKNFHLLWKIAGKKEI